MEPNKAACVCVCVCVYVIVCERQRHREKESPCDCVLQLDEVLDCDSWGRWSNLSFIRPYWAACRQVCLCLCVSVCVCVFSIKSIWQIFMSTFVCVPNIHSVGSSLMSCARYFTRTLLHAYERWAFGLISLAFKSFNMSFVYICLPWWQTWGLDMFFTIRK